MVVVTVLKDIPPSRYQRKLPAIKKGTQGQAACWMFQDRYNAADVEFHADTQNFARSFGSTWWRRINKKYLRVEGEGEQ